MLLVVAPFAGTPSLALDTGQVASVLVLGVLGSGLAYVLTHTIVRAAGATTFSLVTYVIPIFSTLLGVDDPVRERQLEPAGRRRDRPRRDVGFTETESANA